jgi:hypothetical protein
LTGPDRGDRVPVPGDKWGNAHPHPLEMNLKTVTASRQIPPTGIQVNRVGALKEVLEMEPDREPEEDPEKDPGPEPARDQEEGMEGVVPAGAPEEEAE